MIHSNQKFIKQISIKPNSISKNIEYFFCNANFDIVQSHESLTIGQNSGKINIINSLYKKEDLETKLCARIVTNNNNSTILVQTQLFMSLNFTLIKKELTNPQRSVQSIQNHYLRVLNSSNWTSFGRIISENKEKVSTIEQTCLNDNNIKPRVEYQFIQNEFRLSLNQCWLIKLKILTQNSIKNLIIEVYNNNSKSLNLLTVKKELNRLDKDIVFALNESNYRTIINYHSNLIYYNSFNAEFRFRKEFLNKRLFFSFNHLTKLKDLYTNQTIFVLIDIIPLINSLSDCIREFYPSQNSLKLRKFKLLTDYEQYSTSLNQRYAKIDLDSGMIKIEKSNSPKIEQFNLFYDKILINRIKIARKIESASKKNDFLRIDFYYDYKIMDQTYQYVSKLDSEFKCEMWTEHKDVLLTENCDLYALSSTTSSVLDFEIRFFDPNEEKMSQFQYVKLNFLVENYSNHSEIYLIEFSLKSNYTFDKFYTSLTGEDLNNQNLQIIDYNEPETDENLHSILFKIHKDFLVDKLKKFKNIHIRNFFKINTQNCVFNSSFNGKNFDVIKSKNPQCPQFVQNRGKNSTSKPSRQVFKGNKLEVKIASPFYLVMPGEFNIKSNIEKFVPIKHENLSLLNGQNLIQIVFKINKNASNQSSLIFWNEILRCDLIEQNMQLQFIVNNQQILNLEHRLIKYIWYQIEIEISNKRLRIELKEYGTKCNILNDLNQNKIVLLNNLSLKSFDYFYISGNYSNSLSINSVQLNYNELIVNKEKRNQCSMIDYRSNTKTYLKMRPNYERYMNIKSDSISTYNLTLLFELNTSKLDTNREQLILLESDESTVLLANFLTNRLEFFIENGLIAWIDLQPTFTQNKLELALSSTNIYLKLNAIDKKFAFLNPKFDLFTQNSLSVTFNLQIIKLKEVFIMDETLESIYEPYFKSDLCLYDLRTSTTTSQIINMLSNQFTTKLRPLTTTQRSNPSSKQQSNNYSDENLYFNMALISLSIAFFILLILAAVLVMVLRLINTRDKLNGQRSKFNSKNRLELSLNNSCGTMLPQNMSNSSSVNESPTRNSEFTSIATNTLLNLTQNQIIVLKSSNISQSNNVAENYLEIEDNLNQNINNNFNRGEIQIDENSLCQLKPMLYWQPSFSDYANLFYEFREFYNELEKTKNFKLYVSAESDFQTFV